MTIFIDTDSQNLPDAIGKCSIYYCNWRKYKIACEYQGEQHFKPVSYFGGKTSLESNKERDARKKRISKFNNVKLIEVMPDYNLKNLVRKISKFIGIEPPEAQYVDTKDLPGIDKLSKYRKRK